MNAIIFMKRYLCLTIRCLIAPFVAKGSIINRQFCCENINIIIDDGSKRVCISCGDIHAYEYAPPNVNFYGNLHLLRRASVYQCKYYVRKRLLDLKPDSIQIRWSDLNKIVCIFNLFGNLKTNRIRMPRFNFIFKKLFKIMGIHPNWYLNETNSKRTLEGYER